MRTEYVETRKIVEVNEKLVLPNDGREIFGILYPLENVCCKGKPVLIVERGNKLAFQCGCGNRISKWDESLRVLKNTLDAEQETFFQG